MLSDSITNHLEVYFDGAHSTRAVVRRGRPMEEQLGLSVTFYANDILGLGCRPEEYQQYYEMIKDQIPRFQKYLQQDKYSRRLLIQFPVNWYDDKPEDYMPCPESFLVQYETEDRYTVIFNERSVELSRAAEDIGIVLRLCRDGLHLPGQIQRMKVHYMNLHKYLDGGSSEDFDVTNGYFEKK